MKSVKIKLDQLNQNKSNKLRSILTDLELVAKDYLSVKKTELETKQYQRYTSQTCSSCGQKEKSNRISQSLYVCSSCGTRLNADINAARNIRALSGMDGLFVNQAHGALSGNHLL